MQSARPHKGQMLIKLKGVDSIEDVEQWRNARVQIPRSEAPKPVGDEYFRTDLIGLDVCSELFGRRLGLFLFMVFASDA